MEIGPLFLILDGVVLIAALIYYKGREKPKWLQIEIDLAKSIARFFGIIKRVYVYVKR